MVKFVGAHLLLTWEKRPVTMMFGGKQPSHPKRPRRLAWPRTSPFHGGNAGSNPAGDAKHPSMLAAAFSFVIGSEKENGWEKLPAVSGGLLQPPRSAATDPNEAISAPPYRLSSWKTRSRSLPTCRGSCPSRCQSLTHKNTGPPG